MFRLHNHASRALVVLFTLLFFSSSVLSQISATPSASQIEMFKNLPKSQQMALAKQMGVDPSMLQGVTGGKSAQMQTPQETPEQQYIEQDETKVEQPEQPVSKNGELKAFGYDMFEQLQSSFLPSGAVPVPADYMVGPGDSVNITLFGKESSQFTLTIDNEGKLTLPDLEPITVAGLTYSELKQFIEQTVSNKMIGIKSAVSIAQLGGIQVYVIGEVKKPGAYHLSSLSTVLNALFISGGPSEVGSLRQIEVKRAGKTISKIDLYELFIKGDVSKDVRLQQGDVVFVDAIASQVSISGEVRRPAIYELIGDETIDDLINMAGGLNVNAYPKHAILARFDENYQRDVQRIDLKDANTVQQNLKNGDVVTVLPISERLDQVVHVAGAVSRPTTYAWSNDMQLSELISNKDDLIENTDLDYALILSKNALGNYVVEQFKPNDVLAGKSIRLSAGDLVVFFNRFDKRLYAEETESETDNGYLYAIQNGSFFEKQKALAGTKNLSRRALVEPINRLLVEASNTGTLSPIINVTGQVRFPGQYPKAENAVISDAIYAAGGLTESANLFKGEVSRSEHSEDESLKTKHMPFDLIGALSNVEEHNLKLEARDVVNVFQKSNWNDELTITLSGEVKYPGTYTVNEGETLDNVIDRAGGLTEFASIESAFFTRQTLRELEVKQAQDMARALSKELALKSISSTVSNINVGEVQQLVTNLTAIEGVGRLVINLQDVLDKKQMISIENGDELIVPSFRNEVNVIGEVQVATSHLYNGNWSLEDYIKSSGGLKQQSDDDRIYIIQANGLVKVPDTGWFSDIGSADIAPGDTIVVPLDAGYTDRLTLWEKTTAIFYQMTVGLAALASFR